MQKSVYEDYKYSMQDTSSLYIGAKYTLQEITENEEILFKMRKVIAESFIPRADRQDSLETVLYYLSAEDFLVQICKQMRARVRVSIIEERYHLFRGRRKEYVTKFLTMDQLVHMSKEDKEAVGLVIQELKVSKIALLAV